MTRESVEISSDEEALKKSEQNRDKRERDKLYTYKHNFGVVEIHGTNLRKGLKAMSYLTDDIVQFYCAYLLNKVPPECSSRIHIFDSIFHGQLDKIFQNKLDSKKLKQLINKWLNNIDIFDKNYLIFPVCQDDHWFVIVVCYPSAVLDPESVESCISNTSSSGGDTSILRNGKQVPGIIVMDSLQRDKPLITRQIRAFLDFAWREKLRGIKNFSYHNLKEYCPALPSQTNAFDCGVYMLAYIKCFIEQPERFYRQVRKDSDESREVLKNKIESCLKDTTREAIHTLIKEQTVVQTDQSI